VLELILSPKTCAKCRICCNFDKTDIWEIPIFSEKQKNTIRTMSSDGFSFQKRNNSYVFQMDFKGKDIAFCPALCESGCVLGEEKPFDCNIWPFRVMRLKSGDVALVLSPVCPSVQQHSVKTIMEFVSGEFQERVFKEAKDNPDIIKDYIDGYPIFWVWDSSLF
jgi:Fe-S-cluster containining protein